jgi:hypothetical protein
MTQYGTRAGRRIVDLPTIAIAGGGTGATTAATAFDALKQAATDAYTGVVELATTAEAVTGTDTSRAVTAAGLTAFAQTWGHAPDVIVEDQKSSGTAGGTFTSGADQVRVLNTLVRNHGTLASLATNQITLPAGTFYITWSAPAIVVSGHQAFLYNVTDATEVKRGSTEFANAGSGAVASTHSRGSAVVTIAGAKAFEIRHRCTTTRATDGYGVAASFGTEVYTRVEITKVA